MEQRKTNFDCCDRAFDPKRIECEPLKQTIRFSFDMYFVVVLYAEKSDWLNNL